MLNSALLQAATVNKAIATKMGIIFAPAVVLSFVGGMLLWRALHTNNDKLLQKKLADLKSDNAELKQQLQQLPDTFASKIPAPVMVIQEKGPQPIFLPKSTTSTKKLGMLEKVLEENIQLRA